MIALALGFGGAAASAGEIKIGMVTPITGPAAESGKYAQIGAKMAIDEINAAGGVNGNTLSLVVEDDQTTNPGAVAAFSRLATQADIPVFLGSIRSTQVDAMSPDILKLGKPVFIGGTAPQLTHQGNPWLFRCRPNDSYSARVIADFGVDTLGLKKWAIVHSTDAFGSGGMNALTAALKSHGLEPALVQGYPNQSADFSAVVLAVKSSGADIIGSYFTFENDLGIFAKQLRQFGVQAKWVGSPSITTATALKLAGPTLNGTYGIADFAADSSPEAKAFNAKYESIAKVPADNFGSWTFDAVHIAAKAMTDAKSTDPAKVRDAILAIKGYKGAEGTYNFDQNGDGLHGYNIVQNQNGKISFTKHVDYTD
ncbi:amino acid ABC transporter substrate-binding protein [Aliidongia dinghuensis]|uniref:Amino acid ABC transporter substrate-binding protein n=2 Tax=Aliidongia dinghuensis TaxID=1867774 RepID=A0A8J2YTA2_9PROT|nr:amino acid ABC transporter substrate-binding protein [Aliidongia dinghuensis]